MPQKQGEGKIDWCSFTWNPIRGKCGYDCPYCYMHGIRRRFKLDDDLRLDEKELKWNPREPSKIFVCSSLDIMHPDIPRAWVDRVLNVVESHPQHIYQFLTKNPCGYSGFDMPENSWLGTTVDGLDFTITNFMDMATLKTKAAVKFISFEPLLRFPHNVVGNFIGGEWDDIDWIIIGADSSRGAVYPPVHWASKLRLMAREHSVAVWVKENYPWWDSVGARPKEFPEVV